MHDQATAFWTEAEIREAHKLSERCEAEDAKWRFADWLLRKLPVKPGQTRGRDIGVQLSALSDAIGLSSNYLRLLRRTALSWPSDCRHAEASFTAHSSYVTGGALKAQDRWASMDQLPRNRWGRINVSDMAAVGLGGESRRLRSEIVSVKFDNVLSQRIRAGSRADGVSYQKYVARLLEEAFEARERSAPAVEKSARRWLRKAA